MCGMNYGERRGGGCFSPGNFILAYGEEDREDTFEANNVSVKSLGRGRVLVKRRDSVLVGWCGWV